MMFDPKKSVFVKTSVENKNEDILGGSDACQVNNEIILIITMSNLLQGDSGGPLTAYKKMKAPNNRVEYRAFLIGNSFPTKAKES